MPYLGKVPVGHLEPETLDAIYAELRRCRKHCTTLKTIDHRTNQPHDCDDRCRKHRCRPLGATTVRHIQFILSGAYRKAVRWRWVAFSPLS